MKDLKNKGYFLQNLVKHTYRSRLVITLITLVTFFGIVGGLGFAIWTEASITHEWKEVLLLVLGAFIGSYNKVIDFWFNALERDRDMVTRADEEDGIQLKPTQRICDCEKSNQQ